MAMQFKGLGHDSHSPLAGCSLLFTEHHGSLGFPSMAASAPLWRFSCEAVPLAVGIKRGAR